FIFLAMYMGFTYKFNLYLMLPPTFERFENTPPYFNDIMLGIALGILLLFLINLYKEYLIKQIQKEFNEENYSKLPLTQKASNDISFKNKIQILLLSFPLLITLFTLPEYPHVSFSILLFVGKSIKDAQNAKNKQFSLYLNNSVLKSDLEKPRSISFDDLKKLDVKYNTLFFIYNDNNITTIPLTYLPNSGSDIEWKEKFIKYLDKNNVYVTDKVRNF
ncbi:MAG: hypothetical protein ABEH43_09160, partial [Flavobacteriales bacterium]